jgi:hypothetical protein
MQLKDEFEQLYKDVIWLYYNIQEYKVLFINSDNTHILKLAANYFNRYQMLFWDNVLISISRLNDPLKQGNNYNLSIDLMSKFAKENNLRCIDIINTEINNFHKKCELIKIWRCKIIAHRDLDYALKEDYSELIMHLSEIQDIIDSIGKCFEIIYTETENKSISWHVVTNNDTSSLINYLNQGRIYTEMKKERNNWKMDADEYSKYFDIKSNGS